MPKMSTIFIIITTVLMFSQAQVTSSYPNNNYNSYATYRPTFSNLNTQSYTTSLPYAYGGNPYNTNYYNQLGYNNMHLSPYGIDQYATYPYYSYINTNYNYPYSMRAALQAYDTSGVTLQSWQQAAGLGKK